jgi:hypothetical protein
MSRCMSRWGLIITTVFFAIMGFAGIGKDEGALIGVASLFFVALGIVSMINYLRLKTALPQGAGPEDEPSETDLGERLDEIDRRLTDVQDVMIALSEKFDRWEVEKTRI